VEGEGEVDGAGVYDGVQQFADGAAKLTELVPQAPLPQTGAAQAVGAQTGEYTARYVV
jgi:hypothetical protein